MASGRDGEQSISRLVELLRRLLYLREPGVEVRCRRSNDLEVLVGETGAAVLRVATGEPSRRIGLEIEPRLHPGHGVDLAAECRDIERVHHRVGGDLEAERSGARA